MKSPRERTAFANRMRDARTEAGLTQQAVQKALQISQSNLSDLENIAESSTYTAQLARLYRVEAHWLATGEGPKRRTSLVPSPQPFRDLNPYESQLVTLFRQLTTEKQEEVLLAVNHLVAGSGGAPSVAVPFGRKHLARGISVFGDLDDEAGSG